MQGQAERPKRFVAAEISTLFLISTVLIDGGQFLTLARNARIIWAMMASGDTDRFPTGATIARFALSRVLQIEAIIYLT